MNSPATQQQCGVRGSPLQESGLVGWLSDYCFRTGRHTDQARYFQKYLKQPTAHGILSASLIMGLWAAALLLALLHLAQAGCQVLSGWRRRMSRWNQAPQSQHRGFYSRLFHVFPSMAAFSVDAPRLSSTCLRKHRIIILYHIDSPI